MNIASLSPPRENQEHISLFPDSLRSTRREDLLDLLKILDEGSPVNSLKNKSVQELENIRNILDDSYYNSEKPLISDLQYDIFYNYLISRNPSENAKVGVRIRDNIAKAELPYWMGSLDKKKESKTMERWVSKFKGGDYVISEKLDGISLLLELCEGKTRLYTRGDGKIGSDTTHLNKYLKLDEKLDKASGGRGGYQKHKSTLYVRGELIVSLENYKRFQKDYDNPRQMTAGIVNAKTLRKGVEVIDFVAYQIMGSDDSILEQYDMLQKLGFAIPKYTIRSQIDIEVLTTILCNMKKNSKYSIDGIVITHNGKYPTNTSGNPDHSWAYKMAGESYLTTVEEVQWNISKSGILKPTLKVSPVKMEDVTVNYVTAFNAKYIKDNCIGIGTTIKIIRSGDVIPHIVEIVKGTQALLPQNIKYSWNESGVDIIANMTENRQAQDEYNIKYLTSFCSALGILNLGQATIEKLYRNGWNTLSKILECTPDSFAKIEGLGQRSSERIYNSIQEAIPKVGLAQFVGAAGALGVGIGEKKVVAILEKCPTIFYDETDVILCLKDVKGFGQQTVTKIGENIDGARKLVGGYDKFFNFKRKTVTPPTHPPNGCRCQGWRVVFTGFRDKELEGRILGEGGEVVVGISKNTTHLVVKDLNGKITSKVEKARGGGIKIVDRQFIVEFLNSLG